MKLNRVAQLSTIAVLASVISVSNHSHVSANPMSRPVSSLERATGARVTAQQPAAIMSGTFVAAEQPTSGMARIVTENGQRFLVLDAAFKTSSQGPDLHVVLDPTAKPPMQYQNLTSYVNLGRLQKFNGEQRYPIPAAVNLSNFKSVAIWCRMANATFGYAPLRSTSSAGAAR